MLENEDYCLWQIKYQEGPKITEVKLCNNQYKVGKETFARSRNVRGFSLRLIPGMKAAGRETLTDFSGKTQGKNKVQRNSKGLDFQLFGRSTKKSFSFLYFKTKFKVLKVLHKDCNY